MKTVNLALLTISLLVVSSLVMSTNFTVSNKPIQKLFDDYSLNWAGYYVKGSGYTYASATWIVPTVSTSTSGYSSAWVGIGGVNGNGLIQTGTEHDCLASTRGSSTGEEKRYHAFDLSDVSDANSGSRSGGSNKPSTPCTPIYYVWWETYPTNAEQPISTISVSPGDTMSAYVQKNSDGTWTISITDVTKNQNFVTTVSFTPDQTTAEAIIERPALCFVSCKLTNLANFGTISFSNAAAQTATNYFDLISTKTPITMLDNSFKIMAAPGTLTNPGTFPVTWYRSN